jgi:tungstate transport system permease protein
VATLLQALREAINLILAFDSDVMDILIRSLSVSAAALTISALLGIPGGVWLAFSHFPGKRIFTAFVYTGMGIPPVVAGLVVYLFLSRQGVLGELQWLFSFEAMVIAQIIIATPIIVGVTMTTVQAVDPSLDIQLRALGATTLQVRFAILREARDGVIVGLAAGFGSIISEVGAVMLVGGNIADRTRVLTTAIVLETRKGNFDLALALGIILLSLSFLLNGIMVMGQSHLRMQR